MTDIDLENEPYVVIDGERTYFNSIIRMSGALGPLTKEDIQQYFFWRELSDQEKARVLAYFDKFDCWPPEQRE